MSTANAAQARFMVIVLQPPPLHCLSAATRAALSAG